MAKRQDLRALRNMIDEAHTILETTTLPQGRAERAKELLSTALKLADFLMERGAVGKVAVLGMRERGGRTVAKVTPIRSLDSVHGEIHATVEVGTQLYTDDHMVFQGLDGLFYRHDTVNHAAGEYARGPVSTNSIESVWAVLKRGLHGVYHHASAKHLSRYVDEFAWRLNEGDVKRHTLARLDSFIDAVVGKRLTYARLIAPVGVQA